MNSLTPDRLFDLVAMQLGAPRYDGSNSFVKMFKPRFARLVESGAKLQTIRPIPKRVPRVGDGLSLREWTGKSYRSEQRILGRAFISALKICRITDDGITLPSDVGGFMHSLGAPMTFLSGDFADMFARADGFADWAEMRDWFKAEHGLPFVGLVYYWEGEAS